MNKISYKQ